MQLSSACSLTTMTSGWLHALAFIQTRRVAAYGLRLFLRRPPRTNSGHRSALHNGLSPPRTLLFKKEPASDFGFLFGLVDFHQIVVQLGAEFNSTLQRVARISHQGQNPHFIFFLALCLKAATVEFF